MAKVSQKAVLQEAYKSLEKAEACPPATMDFHINLKNRDHAVEEYGYGPLNPEEPNDEFWGKIAKKWGVSVENAKTARCGNCAAFIQTPKMLACISKGFEGKDKRMNDAMAVTEAGNLGYCLFFEFKCAADRTCDAWVVGGPLK